MTGGRNGDDGDAAGARDLGEVDGEKQLVEAEVWSATGQRGVAGVDGDELEQSSATATKEERKRRREGETERRRGLGRLCRAYPSHQVGGEARQAGGVAPLAMRRGKLLLCLLARGRRRLSPRWAGPGDR